MWRISLTVRAVRVVRCSLALCVLRVSFGCVATTPSWRLVSGAETLGWMRAVAGGERIVSQVVRKTGALQLAVASGAIGACVGSNVTVEVSTLDSWCVTSLTQFGTGGGGGGTNSLLACSRFASVPMFLTSGLSCSVAATFVRPPGRPPLQASDMPLGERVAHNRALLDCKR